MEKNTELHRLSLIQLAQKIRKKEVSSEEICKSFLSRGEKLNSKINAWVTMNSSLLHEAQKADKARLHGEDRGPLDGVPIGIKDMICTKGLRTTAASRILENFIPPYDATVVSRLKGAGALILGKLNQDEFAMGSSNETSFFGATRNPWSLEYVPGGSSGGSAAAVSAEFCPAALGTDTGGSIRQPASFCGIVGVKPTYGRMSRYGVIAYASSLDQVGPMSRDVDDSALLLDTMCGFDPHDPTTSRRPRTEFFKNLRPEAKGMKVGYIKEFLEEGDGSESTAIVQKALAQLKSAGAEIHEISLPLLRKTIPVYYLIASSEASSNLSRYDGVRFGFRAKLPPTAESLEDLYRETRAQGFGAEVKRRILLGTFCLSSGFYDAYFKKAAQVRRLIQNEFMEKTKNVDVLLAPVSRQPAFKIGEKISDPLSMYLNDLFTVGINLIGAPAMSVPFSHHSGGLPMGVQVIARPFEEQKMLDVGKLLFLQRELRTLKFVEENL